MQIEVDFEVFKALTMLRQSESHTYNEVLRDLLGLQKTAARQMTERLSGFAAALGPKPNTGFVSRGLYLPDGTLLRAKYKGRTYEAQIEKGRFLLADGREFSSPSGAAHAVTSTQVNGLRFWEARRPSDTEWRKLDALPGATV
jgi:hypothetical protein